MNTRRKVFRGSSLVVLVAFLVTTSNLECLALADNFLNTAKPEDHADLASGLQESLGQMYTLGTSASIEKSLSDDAILSLAKDTASLEGKIVSLDVEIQKEFVADRKILSNPDLPKKGMERYEGFVKEYETRKAEVLKSLAIAKDVKNASEAQAAYTRLADVAKKYSRKNAISPLDVKNLPFRTKKIAKDPEMQVKTSKELEADRTAVSIEKSLATSEAPKAEDLAETEEIIFSPATIACATEIIEAATRLQKNPIRMLRLVADKCFFQPYYGSMKGSIETYRQQVGNDYDLASFLMAMFRYSGIPCRYVTGWIEIPMAEALNYVGVEDPNVLGTILATEGIPAVLMTDKDTGERFLRVKHCWVKAWVPSKYRGAGPGESGAWVYMDPSYKQHEFTTGIDTNEAMKVDPATEQAKVNSHINANSQYSFNFDLNGIRTEMDGYKTNMDEHFAANVPADAPLQKIVNYVNIIPEDFDVLPVSLPYTVVSLDGEYSSIPDNLKYKVLFETIQKDTYDPFSGGTSLSYTANTSSLAGKRIILGYVPATPGDVALVDAYGGVANTPASAADLKPSIRIDGKVVAEGSGYGIGQDEEFRITVTGPDGTNQVISNTNAVGSYHGIAFDLQGVSGLQTRQRFETLKNTASRINGLIAEASKTGSEPNIVVDRDEISGEFLSLVGMMYWTDLLSWVQFGALQNNVLAVKGVGEAISSFGLRTNYFFGLPRGVDPSGTGIDVDLNVMTPYNRKGTEAVNYDFNKQYGLNSSNEEHSVFDQLLSEIFGTTTGLKKKSGHFIHETEGENYPTISAVKALRVANEQGVPIYSLDKPEAYTAVQGELQLSEEVASDVVNALNAGKVVVVHQRQITYYQWSGFGYIITDPQTGAGAYMISGGTNGGETAANPMKDAIEWLFGKGSTGYVIATTLFVITTLMKAIAPLVRVANIIYKIVNLITELMNAEKDGKYCPEAKEVLLEVLLMFGILSIILTLAGFLGLGPLIGFVFFIVGMYLSIAIDILKVMIPILCAHIHALDGIEDVKAPDLIKIYYGWLQKLKDSLSTGLVLVG